MKHWKVHRPIAALAAGLALALCACATPPQTPASALEDIYVLRSIREQRPATTDWCAPQRTGFEPFETDPERFFSFWSVRTAPETGTVVDASDTHVAELHGCFGPTQERARQNFYAQIHIGDLSFEGRGECLALAIDFPEPGLYPVRCQLTLIGLPAPYVGGLLTTNTLTSRAAFGPGSDPPGYTQASIATIRLWRSASADDLDSNTRAP